ncbi:uncharacterized protein LOC134135664 [Rhea pennata]|uniref:uncharacterized protein LOC134135664 n=1 Tax=Rhea pennata TaxID=8795 RepID=UPI002E26C33C
MAHLVARSNRVDERGRGVTNSGERNLQIRTPVGRLGHYPAKGTGNDIPCWTNKGHSLPPDGIYPLTLQTLVLHILLLVRSAGANGPSSHQPFQWSLIRWEDQKVLRTSVTPGAPSFTCYLCDIVPTQPCLNLYGFYLCPSSNPGKGYCNYPGHYYCGYWGCETIASDWKVHSPDQYLKVGWGPSGCEPPIHSGGGFVRTGNCSWIYINITNPEDTGWLIGKTWGARLWEPGVDRGGHFLIKKEIIPQGTELVGPNSSLQDYIPSANYSATESENDTSLYDYANETAVDSGPRIADSSAHSVVE